MNDVKQSLSAILEVGDSEVLIDTLLVGVTIETGLESEAQMYVESRVDDMPAGAALARVHVKAAAAEVE